METPAIVHGIGWVGSLSVLTAYALVSAGRVSGASVVYQALNLLGGGCLAVNTLYFGALPAASLNVIWSTVALVALLRRRRRPQAAAPGD